MKNSTCQRDRYRIITVITNCILAGMAVVCSGQEIDTPSPQEHHQPAGDESIASVQGRGRGLSLGRVSLRFPTGDHAIGRVDRVTQIEVRDRSQASEYQSGVLEGSHEGTIHLLHHQGVTAGRVTIAGRGTFTVQGDRERGLRLTPFTDPHHTECLTTGVDAFLFEAMRLDATRTPHAALGGEDGTRIDLMIVYTTAARTEAGSVAGVEAQVLLAIALGNVALTNSLIDTQFRVVHMEEIAYTEAIPPNTLLDLDRVANPADGFVDHVPGLRDTHAADVVAVIVGPAQACGVSPVMDPVSPDFAPFAYCLANWGCAAGNLALPHVIGHNMGCSDQREDGGMGAFAFSFGLYEPSDAFRTIITTQQFPNDLPQIMQFSNPLVSFMGLPTGIADPAPDSADNAQALNITRTTTANFRDGSCPPVGGSGLDCNENCIADETDIAAATSLDCNGNGVPDECDLSVGTAFDCNANGVPDSCDISGGSSDDCNNNAVPDDCDFADPVNELFDAFITLFTDGWRMSNHSDPLGSATWGPGSSLLFPAHAGLANSSFIINDFNAAGNPPPPPTNIATISDWLFTPEVPLANDTEISFFTRTLAGSTFPDRLQLRMSTAGASTNVGGTHLTVGDFTTLLVEVNAAQSVGGYPTAWQQFTATVTGLGGPTTGRFAFRYFVVDAGPTGSNSNLIGIDHVQVIPPVPDVNTNGVRDACDIGRGDSNLDGIVGILDFLAVLANWGPCPAPCPYDSNDDGLVGILDFLNVLANWG